MIKKTSTPTKPPETHSGKAWNATTLRTAIARNPSISGRYFGCNKLVSVKINIVPQKIGGVLTKLVATLRYRFKFLFLPKCAIAASITLSIGGTILKSPIFVIQLLQ